MLIEQCYYIGITPACAGISMGQLCRQIVIGDHPRMRGDKRRPTVTTGLYWGSPPHARG